MTQDRAGKAYWDEVWAGAAGPTMNPASADWRGYTDRAVARFMQNAAGTGNGRRLLELGCANSPWLPFFGRLGFRVAGLDYSEQGCAMAREQLHRAGIQGEVIFSDFFAAPPSTRGAFDVVVSMGVVEHFEDTAACVGAFAAFLKPGGRLITLIPNMVGLPGAIQKHANRSIFDIHVPLSREELEETHRLAGLHVISCDYFLPVSPGVLNVGAGTGIKHFGKRAAIAGLTRLVRPVQRIAEQRDRAWRSRYTSPYVICIAQRPHPTSD